jgi:hypothetical protein
MCRIYRRIYGMLEEKQKCDEQARGAKKEGELTTERLKKVLTEFTELTEL